MVEAAFDQELSTAFEDTLQLAQDHMVKLGWVWLE